MLSRRSEQQRPSTKDKVTFAPLEQPDQRFLTIGSGGGKGRGGGRNRESEGTTKDHSEVLLPSLLRVHGVQDGLSFGSIALPELLDLPLHHRIQGSEAQLQLLKVQVLQLRGKTQKGRKKKRKEDSDSGFNLDSAILSGAHSWQTILTKSKSPS